MFYMLKFKTKDRKRLMYAAMEYMGLSLCLILVVNVLSVACFDDDMENISIGASASNLSAQQTAPAFYNHLLEGVANLTVYIAEAGTDSPDCIHKDIVSPCRTIQHAYSETMMQITNITEYIKFVFMDDRYNMTGALILNREAKFLKNMEFTSTLRTNITGMNEEAVFWIGCNTTSSQPCISYDVEFSNLNFRHFSCELPAVVVVFNINHLSLHDCSFYQNNRSAINLLDTSVVLDRVEFSDNSGNANFKGHGVKVSSSFPLSNFSNGGAVAFVFRDGNCKFVNISSCSFISNSAADNLQLPYVGHSLTDTQFPRVGGGVLILFMGNCTDVHVTFVTSKFLGNTAYGGGAVAIISEFNASSNKVSFIHCKFLRNVAKSTAGAILFSSWDFAERNVLIISRCIIHLNKAMYSGAVKYIINIVQSRNGAGPSVLGLEIIHSSICGNIAETGSAVHIITSAFTDRQKLSPARIVDSVFCQHDCAGRNNKKESVSQYGGTILIHNFDLIFIGKNEIKDNKAACGLFASNANIHVNGTLNITRNVASYSGGGMVLADTSHLILYPRSHLRFEENNAAARGGALAVFSIGMPNVTYIYNPYCFLQYSIPNQPYSKWDTKVEFIRNSAGFKGGAMFINTMTACLWMEDAPHYSFEKAFRWNDKFVYKDNFVGTAYSSSMDDGYSSSDGADIATDTYKLVLHSPKQETIAPGEMMPFNLSGYDELNKATYSVAVAYSRAVLRNSGKEVQSHLDLPSSYFVLDPLLEKGSLQMEYEVSGSNYRGITNDSVQHEITFFDSYSSFVAKAKMNITPIYCRPGYVYDGKRACKCDVNHTSIESCSGTKITLCSQLWATSSNGQLITSRCPPNYCKCTRYSKPGECIYDSLDSDSQCNENRRGVLCGACKGRNNNLSYGLSLDTGKCIECTAKSIQNAIMGLVLLTTGVLCVALLVIYLNPSFSTKMRGPAFYVQMIPYYYSGKSFWGSIMRNAASALTLGGSSRLPISGCLGDDWNMLEIIALTYIFAAVMLAVLLTIYVLSRCLVLRFKRDSPFESFWILLIATYCFFSETSLIFFYCVEVDGKSVFFYDGTVECFHGTHLVLVIVSSIVLLFFVLVPPVAVLLICTGRTNAPLQVADALTKGLRLRYRWWWAVDLFRRFAYVAVFVFARQSELTFSILCSIFLTLHTACQPYKDTFANMSETFLLLSMSVISTLHNAGNVAIYDEVATAIIAVNFVYIFILFLYLVVRFIERRFNRNFGNIFRRFENQNIAIPHRATTPRRVEELHN